MLGYTAWIRTKNNASTPPKDDSLLGSLGRVAILLLFLGAFCAKNAVEYTKAVSNFPRHLRLRFCACWKFYVEA